jgi:hypothetical protein
MQKNYKKIFFLITGLFLIIILIIIASLFIHRSKIKTKIEVAVCKRAGCSGQLCVSSDSKDIVSTCEWKDEYACYQKATCEKQKDNQCGFTPTEESKKCFSDLVPKINLTSIKAIPTSH